jgi:methyl-accepting chemotaxis protein
MADLDNYTVEKLIRAIEALTEQMGRGAGGKSNSRVPHGAKAGSTGSNAMDKAIEKTKKKLEEYNKQIDAGIKLNAKNQKSYDKLKKTVDDYEKSVKSADKATEDLTDSMRDAKEMQRAQSKSLKNFGKDLLTGSGSLGDAFGSLAGGLRTYGGIANKALFGFATGVSFALTAMSDFAKSAADVGSFADLSAFSVGSVKQAKLLSGLGDSFTKVLAESNGGFKAFGKGSQDATENLAQLARGFRSGTWWVSSSIKKNLGPEFTKDIDRAAAASASLGLSTEDTANLMGSLAMSISLNSKNERDAQQKLVKQYADTVTASRNLSDAFGISAKDILAAMADFRKTQAGQVAGLEGNVGAQNLAPLIKAMGIESDPDKIAKIALAISQGDMAKAQYKVSNPAASP